MTASISPLSAAPPDAAGTLPRRPRPWIAALLTWLLPGLGHLYAGRPKRAAAALLALYVGVVPLLLLSFAAPRPVLRLALLLLAFLAPLALLPVDAARVARRSVPGPRRFYQRWYALLGVWAVGAFVVQSAAFDAIRAHVAEAFRIPSGSMAPTILPGDVLLARPRLAHPVQRGTVVIYQLAGDPDRYVHRVVGVPGDTLAMRAFRLTVNGQAAPWPRATPTPGADAEFTDAAFAWQHSRLAPGAEPVAGEPTYGTWGPLVLRADEYFVLGDDYGNSLDSRHRGVISQAAFAGQPGWVYFSRDPDTGTIRWERLGYRIR
jgi:signal peptidase I